MAQAICQNVYGVLVSFLSAAMATGSNGGGDKEEAAALKRLEVVVDAIMKGCATKQERKDSVWVLVRAAISTTTGAASWRRPELQE